MLQLLFAAGLMALPVAAQLPGPGELAGPAEAGGLISGPTDERSAAEKAWLAARIEAARNRLYAERRLPRPDPFTVTVFTWPLRSAGIGYHAHWGTSAFLDQNPGAGQTSDYDCGSRTYDQHDGTDFFTWPYGWLSLDASRLQVVAAAPGTILLRDDGHDDRSCSLAAARIDRRAARGRSMTMALQERPVTLTGRRSGRRRVPGVG
jgi:hypothetical protein